MSGISGRFSVCRGKALAFENNTIFVILAFFFNEPVVKVFFPMCALQAKNIGLEIL
jgi:hypothetical protein